MSDSLPCGCSENGPCWDHGPQDPFDWLAEGYVCQALHRVPLVGCIDCNRAAPAEDSQPSNNHNAVNRAVVGED